MVAKIREHKFTYAFFALMGLLFLFTRLFKIMSIPDGMHIDEVSMGYNVWSLSNFGTDRYGVSYPVYFDNAGSGQSSLYVYVAVLLSKIFGYSVFLLRFVSVLFGAALLVFATLAAYELFNLRAAYITSAIVVIMPVFIMGERWAFDCNTLLPMFAMLLYFGAKLCKTGEVKYAIWSGISISLCLYSYILSFIILPVFLLCAVIYLLASKKVTFRNTLITALSGLILSVPILLYAGVVFASGIMHLRHMDDEAWVNAFDLTFNIGPMTITDASFRRMAELGVHGVSLKSFFSALYKITSYDNYEFVATEKYGTFYSNKLIGLSFSQLLIIMAFVVMIVCAVQKIIKKEFSSELVLLFAGVAALSPMFFTEGFAVYRYGLIFVIFALMLGSMFDKALEKEIRIPCAITALAFLLNFGSYNIYLFGGGFSDDYTTMSYFDSDLLHLCEEMNVDAYQDYDIYIDDKMSYNAGLIALYAMKVEPNEVVEKVENMDEAGMTIGNIHIGIPAKVDTMQKAIYIIRDLNKGGSLYTDSREPDQILYNLLEDHSTEKVLQNRGTPMVEKYDYKVYVLN